MKCRFCQSQMLPHEAAPNWDTRVSDVKIWSCHNCPNRVNEPGNQDVTDWFSIVTMYNGSWYEIDQMYTSPNAKEPPLLAVHKYVFYKLEDNTDCVGTEFVLEINVDAKITPQNIQAKLATILTFS